MHYKPFYVYEFSYPEEIPERAGIVFYVGMSNTLTRLDKHLTEASGPCGCERCCAIRSIWDEDLLVVRRVVFL